MEFYVKRGIKVKNLRSVIGKREDDEEESE